MLELEGQLQMSNNYKCANTDIPCIDISGFEWLRSKGYEYTAKLPFWKI